MTMTLSDNGLAFIKRHEGRYLYWYQLDDGGLTCGYGHWVPHATAKKMGIKKGDKITQQVADGYLRQDMQKFINHTNAIVKQYGFAGKFNQSQFDALVSYCFNRGPGNSKGTNGLRQLVKNSKTVTDISNNLMIYWGTNQTYKKGLLNRRKAEQTLFNTPAINKPAKEDDELVFSSATLEASIESLLKDKAKQRDLIEKAIEAKAINESWRDKYDKGTLAKHDIVGLATLYAIAK